MAKADHCWGETHAAYLCLASHSTALQYNTTARQYGGPLLSCAGCRGELCLPNMEHGEIGSSLHTSGTAVLVASSISW
jgi:hypothetical protein